MPFPTAYQRGHKHLYHWQPLHRDRLEVILRSNTIYCSRPGDFNDPWDCRPYFNSDFLSDSDELKRHVDCAVEICRRDGQMSAADRDRMSHELQDPAVLEYYVRKINAEMQEDVLDHYRVYCMCPDAGNALMWAHYGDSHRGVCLEFNVENEAICSALEVQYFKEFPMTRQYSEDPAENLLPLLAKAEAWAYEREYRLIAQETGNATDHDTLKTDGGQLELPAGALSVVIVGCNADYDAVASLIHETSAGVALKRAYKVPNRYELKIED